MSKTRGLQVSVLLLKLSSALAISLAADLPAQSTVEPALGSPPGNVARTLQPLGIDSLFLEIERESPGFAGAFVDPISGDVVIRQVGSQRREHARARVQAMLAARRRGLTRTRFMDATYSIRQLVAWRNTIQSLAFAQTPGDVNTIGILHDDNRVLVGVTNARGESALRRALRANGIPFAAVRIERREPMSLAASLAEDTSLPARAGTQILHLLYPHVDSVFMRCTLGFNAIAWTPQAGTANSIVTASHCTRQRSVLQSIDVTYQQIPGTNTLRRLGPKAVDPAFFHCPDTTVIYADTASMNYYNDCRYSDAAIVRYDSAGPQFGSIAIPASLNDSASAVSALLPIANDDIDWPLQGDTLDAIGVSSGHRRGVVICANCHLYQHSDGKWMLLQTVVALPVKGGDSGGPVFRFNSDSTASLAGLVWGGNLSYTVFSPLGGIKADLPIIAAMTRYPGDRGPISAGSILPGIPPAAYESQRFWVNPVGGFSSLSCSWKADGVTIESSACDVTYTNSGAEFFLGVTVSDALGHSLSIGRWVTPSNPCYPYDCETESENAGIRSASRLGFHRERPAIDPDSTRLLSILRRPWYD